jgi:hypothetical protein
VARADTDLEVYLDAAIRALGAGFDPVLLVAEPKAEARRRR